MAELEARHSWLADNKLCRPNPEAITNANSILSIGPFPIILIKPAKLDGFFG
jgi:hypothetical protein